jgi:hypothetical protein
VREWSAMMLIWSIVSMMLTWSIVSAAPQQPHCAPNAFAHGVDLYGGDLMPLGVGFRNESSAEACCSACSTTSGCLFFSFSPRAQADAYAAGQGGKSFPKHNCWLKASAGKPHNDRDRVSGGSGARPLPPMPPHPRAGIPPPCANKSIATHPWCDTSKSALQRAKAAVAMMTTVEKASQLQTWTPGIAPGIPRLDWPEYGYHSEGLHGLRDSQDAAMLPSTVFPQTTGMAATGNITMIAEMGRVMGVTHAVAPQMRLRARG